MKDKLTLYGVYSYFFAFFLILFFGHKYIDILRAPFILFILWQVASGKLNLKFFVDPVFIGTALFVLTVLASNLINHVPQHEVVQILNWLFPYALGKYAIGTYRNIDVENILFFLLAGAALFSGIGIFGYFFNTETLFGVELFEWYGKEARYAFTMSGTNKAGFCIGITLVVNCYFFIKNGFRFSLKNVWVIIGFCMVFAALFLIKERKTFLMVCTMIGIFLLLYKKYKAFILLVLVAGLVVAWFPLPHRYNVKEMFFDDGMVGRFNAWECAFGMFKEKPLLGHGYPSFKTASAVYFEKNKADFKFKKFYNYGIAHNLNLNALAETGIFGLVALNIIFLSAWRFVKYKRTDPLVFVFGAAIAFIYITMQFGNFVHSATRTDMAFLILGMYFSLEQLHRPSPSVWGFPMKGS